LPLLNVRAEYETEVKADRGSKFSVEGRGHADRRYRTTPLSQMNRALAEQKLDYLSRWPNGMGIA
jgi:hypothetical protein